MSLLLALGCVSNQSNSLNKDNTVSLNPTQNYNYCVQQNETHYISFDFGDEIVTDKNVFYCKIIDDFDEMPSITHSGNIGLEIISSKLNNHYVKLTLPEEDGQIEINFVLNEESARGLLFSSKGKNDQYAVSSLSLYSAWGLVGNIPGQEYMDNDTIEAEDRGPTPEFNEDKSGGPQRAIAGGRVYGYLKWTDDGGNIHPLIGVKVKLTFSGSWGDSSTYTNSSGYFDINFSGIWTVSAYECDIHIYAENDMIKVTNKNGNIYEKAHRFSGMSNNSTYNYGTYIFSETQDDDLGRAMQIFAAGRSYAEYARTLNGGVNIEQCKIIYPTSSEPEKEDEGAYYTNDSDKAIHLGFYSQRHCNSCPSVHGSWDVIGHEYGHHLQKLYFMKEYYGRHRVDYNDIRNYFEYSSSGIIDDQEIKNAKINGIGLAWKEAWPTFFAISAQSTFSSDLKKVPTVGDYFYTAFNDVMQDLTSLKNTYSSVYGEVNGESDEEVIMSFLYRLWDSANNISCDKISISDSDLWTFIVANNPENFSDFISKLYSSDLNFSRSDLGLLLEAFKISASNLSVSISADYTEAPTISWTKNGTDIIFNGTTYNYGNNKFTLHLYDSSKNQILEQKNLTDNFFEIPQAIWDSILVSSSTKYYVMIESYATLGGEAGPYYSQYYEFTKPTFSTVNQEISIHNDRYYEKTLIMSQGSNWTFNLSFDRSGNKMIQTFGLPDTKMWLYDETGTQIEFDDDDGYKLNSFINRYFEAGKKYTLKVKLYSDSTAAKTRLSITPISGIKNNEDPSLTTYENIWHVNSVSNYSFGSYLSRYNSKVISWTPVESGNYKITLTSEFDNYLYVIDPSSSELNKNNVHQNDDFDGRNAGLEGYYSKDITYFIVFAQYNPSNDFANLDTGDDITIRINKVQ